MKIFIDSLLDDQQISNSKRPTTLDMADRVRALEQKHSMLVSELREVINELRMRGQNCSRLNVVYTRLLT